jgi:hypothetical protein
MLGAWALETPERNSQSVAEVKSQPVLRAPNRTQPPLPKFLSDAPAAKTASKATASKARSSARYVRRKIVMLLAASVIVAGAVGWWQWEQGWQELESRMPGRSVEVVQPTIAVPQDVMLRLLIHKVEPRGGLKVTGVAVLSAVIGRDGSVVSLRPMSGPEILTRAAMDSVQWWKFEPYRQNGEPVEVETTLAINFP